MGSSRPIVVPPGQGHRLGNVEFLARTADTPRFNCGIIEIAAGRELEAHVHDAEDDAFYILEGELTFTFGEAEAPAPPGTFVLVPPNVDVEESIARLLIDGLAVRFGDWVKASEPAARFDQLARYADDAGAHELFHRAA